MEDNEKDYLMPRALALQNVPDNYDPSVTPTSAEEYLQSVMWEAKQCPDVVTLEVDRAKLKKLKPLVKVTSKMAPPAGYGPSREEVLHFQKKFLSLRDQVEGRKNRYKGSSSTSLSLPKQTDEKGWCMFCFGEEFHNRLSSSENNVAVLPELSDGSAPLLSVLLNITPACLDNLLIWHTKWLEKLGFSAAQGRWMFALLAVLGTPLTPEMCSTLRHIVKLLAVIRASLVSKSHAHLLDINMLITLITTYFGQTDLADDIP